MDIPNGIYVYMRKKAIEDGVLVDIMALPYHEFFKKIM